MLVKPRYIADSIWNLKWRKSIVNQEITYYISLHVPRKINPLSKILLNWASIRGTGTAVYWVVLGNNKWHVCMYNNSMKMVSRSNKLMKNILMPNIWVNSIKSPSWRSTLPG